MNEYVKIKGTAKYVGLEEDGIIRGSIVNVAVIDFPDGVVICQAETPSGHFIQYYYSSIYSVYKDWVFLKYEFIKEDF